MEKGTILVFHNPESVLDGNEYTVQRVTDTTTYFTGCIYPKMRGSDKFQFHWNNTDLKLAISLGFYTIKTV